MSKTSPPAPGRKAGRPPYIATQEDRESVALLKANGIDLPTIAKILKVSPSTVQRYYGDALRDGHQLVTAKVGAVLLRAALSGNIAAATRWLIMKGGWYYPKGQGLSEVAPEDLGVVHFFMPPNDRDKPEVIIEHEIPPAMAERLMKAMEPPALGTPRQAPGAERLVPASSSWHRLAKSG